MTNPLKHLQARAGLLFDFTSGSFVPSALLKSSSLIVGARILGAVFGIFTQIALARLLSVEDIGLFFMAISLAAVLSIICTMGYPMLVPSIVAQANSEKNPARLAAFMSQSRRDTVIFSVIVLTVLGLAVWALPSLSDGFRKSLIFAALTLPAFVMMRLHGALANAHKRFGLGFLPDLFIRPLLLLVFVLVAWLSWTGLSIELILSGHVVIAIMLALWQMVRLANKSWIVGSPDNKTWTPARADRTGWRRKAAPTILAALFVGVFADLDIILAGLVLNEAQIGIFGVSLKISLFVAFGIQAIHQLILRDAADALQAKNHAQFHEIVRRANALSLMGSIAATVIVLVFGREILGIFGPQFQAGFISLCLLMFAQVVRAAAGPATQILTLSGNGKSCLPVFFASIIFLVASNIILAQWFGMVGAAVAVLLVYSLWSFWMAAIVRKKLGLSTCFLFPAIA